MMNLSEDSRYPMPALYVRHGRFIIAFVMLGALAGCASGPTRSPVVTPQKMSCSGNIPAQITLYSPEEAVLAFEDHKYTLNRVQTASGAKYENGNISYWSKGIDALITREDGTMATCTAIPQNGL